MTMQGTLAEIDGKLCVRYATTYENEPTRQIMYWACERAVRNPYNANAPTAGDHARYNGNGSWDTSREGSGSTGSVSTGAGDRQAFKVEREPVPCPKVRKGLETRWYQGAWQKLMAKGWVPA